MLKCTISRVFNEERVTENGTVIDAEFAYQSVSDRIVESPIITGAANVVLKELSKQFGQHLLEVLTRK
jgi:hypothetical protein